MAEVKPRITTCPGLSAFGCRSAIDANLTDLCSRCRREQKRRADLPSARPRVPGFALNLRDYMTRPAGPPDRKETADA